MTSDPSAPAASSDPPPTDPSPTDPSPTDPSPTDPAPADRANSPWGQPWPDLLQYLRPTPSQENRLNAIVATVRAALADADIHPVRIELGGPFGSGTMSASSLSLHIFAIFDPFYPHNYFERHLTPITDAISEIQPTPSSILRNDFTLTFVSDDIPVSLCAAAHLPAGPALLAHPQTAPDPAATTDPRNVHLHTSCAVLRAAALSTQPLLFKDMVRVAEKWLQTAHFKSHAHKPSHYLVQLLVLSAVRSAPVQNPSSDLYHTIMRTFFSLASSTVSSSQHLTDSHKMPSPFLWWPFYYDRHVVDWCVANYLLSPSPRDTPSPLLLLDIAAPFVNVADSLADWDDFRRVARDALQKFERSDVIEKLQDRLQALTDGFHHSVDNITKQVDYLRQIELSPRRWTGSLKFSDKHISSEHWTPVMEVTLRTTLWRVNARRARTENIGYGALVDLSLQMVGDKLDRSIDVDVVFRSSTIYVVFDKDNDHVFLQKRSEVIRNRDYPLQITVVA